MNAPVLYRRRLIPDECVPLKDDVILLCKPDLLVTGWRALKPRRDLHHGFIIRTEGIRSAASMMPVGSFSITTATSYRPAMTRPPTPSPSPIFWLM